MDKAARRKGFQEDRTIWLADPNDSVRSALRILLEEHGWSVLGEDVSFNGLMAHITDVCPAVIILDSGILQSSSKQIQLLKEQCPGAKLIIMSGQPENKKKADQSGADGFLSKTSPPERVLMVMDELEIDSRL